MELLLLQLLLMMMIELLLLLLLQLLLLLPLPLLQLPLLLPLLLQHLLHLLRLLMLPRSGEERRCNVYIWVCGARRADAPRGTTAMERLRHAYGHRRGHGALPVRHTIA